MPAQSTHHIDMLRQLQTCIGCGTACRYFESMECLRARKCVLWEGKTVSIVFIPRPLGMDVDKHGHRGKDEWQTGSHKTLFDEGSIGPLRALKVLTRPLMASYGPQGPYWSPQNPPLKSRSKSGLYLSSWRTVQPVGGRDPGQGNLGGILGGPITKYWGRSPPIFPYISPPESPQDSPEGLLEGFQKLNCGSVSGPLNN